MYPGTSSQHHAKLQTFQSLRTTVLALLQYCIDCDKCYERKEYTSLIAFLCTFAFDEITANSGKDKNIC